MIAEPAPGLRLTSCRSEKWFGDIICKLIQRAFEKKVVIGSSKHFRWFGAFPVLRQDTCLDSPWFQCGGHAGVPLLSWLWDH